MEEYSEHAKCEYQIYPLVSLGKWHNLRYAMEINGGVRTTYVCPTAIILKAATAIHSPAEPGFGVPQEVQDVLHRIIQNYNSLPYRRIWSPKGEAAGISGGGFKFTNGNGKPREKGRHGLVKDRAERRAMDRGPAKRQGKGKAVRDVGGVRQLQSSLRKRRWVPLRAVERIPRPSTLHEDHQQPAIRCQKGIDLDFDSSVHSIDHDDGNDDYSLFDKNWTTEQIIDAIVGPRMRAAARQRKTSEA
jgi:hypothetical protein